MAYDLQTPKQLSGDALLRSGSDSAHGGAAGASHHGGPHHGSGQLAGAGSSGSLPGLFDRLRRTAGSGSFGAGERPPDSPAGPGGSASGSRLVRVTGEAAASSGGGGDGGEGGSAFTVEDMDAEEAPGGLGSCGDEEDLANINIATPLPDATLGSGDEGGRTGARGGAQAGEGGGAAAGDGGGTIAALDLAQAKGPAAVAGGHCRAASTTEASSTSSGRGAGGGHARSASALPVTGGGGGGGSESVGGGGTGMPHPWLVEGAMDLPSVAASTPASDLTPRAGTRSGPTPTPRGGGGGGGGSSAAVAAAAAELPSRAGDWRLAAALAGAAPFGSLVLELSRLAAWCYVRAGRLRSSALVYADVATMLLQRGELDAACRWARCVGALGASNQRRASSATQAPSAMGSQLAGPSTTLHACCMQLTPSRPRPTLPMSRLYGRMVHIISSERWPALLGHMLPLLISCQRLAGDGGLLPYSCLNLLGLPPSAARPADRGAALEELLLSLGAKPAALAAAPAAALPAAAELEGARLEALPALAVAPARGRWSLFYGSEAGLEGAPVLAPPPRPPSPAAQPDGCVHARPARGAALVNAGDALTVEVEVFSNLPDPVVLTRPELVLARYARAPTWLPPGGAGAQAAAAGMLSPMAGGSGSGLSGNAARLAAAARRSVGADGPRASFGGAGAGAAAAAAAAALANAEGGGGSAMASGDSMGMAPASWMECDELICTRLVAAESLPAAASAGPTEWGEGAAAAAGAESVHSGVEGRGGGAALRLAPGLTRVAFEAAPSREGLYALKHLRARLGAAVVVAGVPEGGQQPLMRSEVRLHAAWGASCFDPYWAQADDRSAHARPARLTFKQACLRLSHPHGTALAHPHGTVLSHPHGTAMSHSHGTALSHSPDPQPFFSLLPPPAPLTAQDAARRPRLGALSPTTGDVASDVVVAAVAPPTPRLAAAAAAPGGALRCGQPQWLGLLITPLHGAPAHARLRAAPGRHLMLLRDPSDAAAAADLLASGGGALQARDAALPPPAQQVCVHALPAAGAWQESEEGQAERARGAGACSKDEQGAGAGGGAAGRWVVMEHNSLDISAAAGGGPLQRPLLLWLQVLVGTPVGEPVSIRVQPPPPLAAPSSGKPPPLPPGGGLQRAQSAGGGGAVFGGLAAGGGRWRAPWASIEIDLDYFDGRPSLGD
jgi:hypothetical protein